MLCQANAINKITASQKTQKSFKNRVQGVYFKDSTATRKKICYVSLRFSNKRICRDNKRYYLYLKRELLK